MKVYVNKYKLPLKVGLILDNVIGFDKSFIMISQGIWKEAIDF